MTGSCGLFTAHGIDPFRVVPGSLTIDYQTCHVTYQQVGTEVVVRPFTAHDVICPVCHRPADAPEHGVNGVNAR